MRILYVTRKFPPMIGGMERYSADLIAATPADHADIIALGLSQRHIVWWLPYAELRALFLLLSRRIDVVHATDALMGAMLLPLAQLFRIPLVVTVHALDVIWPRPWYQWMIRRTLPKADHIVSVSKPTGEYCVARGVNPERITIIPNGIPPLALPSRAEARRSLRRTYGIPEMAFLLVSVGRLIPRKNIAWFVRSVMPHLPERAHLLIVGIGPDQDAIGRAIREHGLSRRVVMAGSIGGADRNAVYAAADLCVMPNCTIPGDAEGFGIVAIEAASCGVPVLTTGIEGIREAITDGKNGVYFPEQDATAAVRAVTSYIDNPGKLEELSRSAREFTHEQFSWKRLAGEYASIYARVIPRDANRAYTRRRHWP